ncbi:hypothetical protein D5R55_27900 [Burkholderia cenocepacia]|uniref:Uncharacterized protein n=1 Tax=Burkholderia cenocepacia TaxID=95486 RepID=A0A3S9NG53_9BURK|nr:hypothetical protein D5R55_27900 [Burkholderia cenocepacia]
MGDGPASVKLRLGNEASCQSTMLAEIGDRVIAFAWLGVIVFGALPTALHVERRHPKPIGAARPCALRAPSRRGEPPPRRPAGSATPDRRPDAIFGA